MTTGILVFHIILAAAMIGIILIQRNEGGALGIGGNTNIGGFMSSRGTANLLTRITAILATSFFITTIVLALLFKGEHKPKSILDDDTTSLESIAPAQLPSSNPTPAVMPATLPASEHNVKGKQSEAAVVNIAPAQPSLQDKPKKTTTSAVNKVKISKKNSEHSKTESQ